MDVSFYFEALARGDDPRRAFAYEKEDAFGGRAMAVRALRAQQVEADQNLLAIQERTTVSLGLFFPRVTSAEFRSCLRIAGPVGFSAIRLIVAQAAEAFGNARLACEEAGREWKP